MIYMNLKSIIEELDQIIAEMPTITPDFSYLPTLEMVEYNTPDHVKNYDIDITCLPEI